MKRSRQRHAAKRRLRRAQKECRLREAKRTAVAYAWFIAPSEVPQ